MTSNPMKRSSTHALWMKGGKYAATATATHIPAPKTRKIGDNDPRPTMVGHGLNKLRHSNYTDPDSVTILEACF